MRSILISLLVVTIFTVGCVQPSSHQQSAAEPTHKPEHGTTPAQHHSFHVIPGTDSPSGKYAVAWGIKGNSKVDWKRLEGGDDKYLDSLLADPEKTVEDYVVNRHSKTVIGTVHGVHYWKIANRSENHGSMQVAWSSDERLAFIVHGGKWTFQSFDAVSLQNGALVHQDDIGNEMTTAIRGWLNKTYPKDYLASKNQLAIDISHPVFVAGNSVFTADVAAEVPKADNGFSFEGKATFHIHYGANHAVHVALQSLHKTP